MFLWSISRAWLNNILVNSISVNLTTFGFCVAAGLDSLELRQATFQHCYYYYYYYYKCHGLVCCHHIVAGALYKNLDLKLLHSSMQTSADHRSRWRHVSRMTDDKGETWSPSGLSKVRSRPESLVADCSMHAMQPPCWNVACLSCCCCSANAVYFSTGRFLVWIIYKNLAIANRLRVSYTHNTSRASIGLNITPWPWNLG